MPFKPVQFGFSNSAHAEMHRVVGILKTWCVSTRPNSWTKSRQKSQEFSSLLFTQVTPLPTFLFIQTLATSHSSCSAGIFKQFVGARNRVGIGLSYRPARLYSLAELVPCNRFLGPQNFINSGSVQLLYTVKQKEGKPSYPPLMV
jgi:hypothetical protein